MQRFLPVFIALTLGIFAGPSLCQAVVPYLTEPSLSPDRREIAFVSGGDIWSVPAEGGAARLLVSHPASESRPLFSPDGSSLAFGSTRTGGLDIYILDLASGQLRRLTFDDAAETLDAWSRDGKWLYFSSTSKDIAGMNDIFRVASTGGTPMQVSADRYTNEFAASPLWDGSIVFAARGIASTQWWRKGRSHIDESEIWQKSGDKYQELSPRGAKQMWPMTTPDGAQVFFVSDRNGHQNIWSRERGGQARPLTNFTDGCVLWASISYDGKEIVFERNFRIWRLKTDGGRAEELPITLRGVASGPLTERVNLGTQVRGLALSPDGKKVAVIARGEVFAASSKDGGEAVRVTNTAAPESYVSWSPDSRKLIYSSERNGPMQLFQYDFCRRDRNANHQREFAGRVPDLFAGRKVHRVHPQRKVDLRLRHSLKAGARADKILHRSAASSRRRDVRLVAGQQVGRIPDLFSRNAFLHKRQRGCGRGRPGATGNLSREL